MPYLYNLYIVVEDDPENISAQNSIDEKIELLLKDRSNADIVGATIHELDTDNCGKCCRCGCWVSDWEMENYIDGFSNGCRIDGEWWCDICLPTDHPKSFRSPANQNRFIQ